MYSNLFKKNIKSIHQELTELWQFYCQHQIILCFLVWQTHVKKTKKLLELRKKFSSLLNIKGPGSALTRPWPDPPGLTLLAWGQADPGPGPSWRWPDPEGQGQGQQKRPRPGLARPLDSVLVTPRITCIAGCSVLRYSQSTSGPSER